MPHPTTVALLLRTLDEAYARKAWHGTNLKGALRGLSLETANWRPGPGRHSIRELALHAAYWKYTVWRQLSGAPRGSFPLSGSNFFPRAGGTTAEWAAERRLLDQQHQRLRGAVEKLEPGDLERRPPGSQHNIEALVRGVAAHDLYHAGQIQLLKRLARAASGSLAR